MAFELSKQEIVKEIVKSGKDPIYFINTYCRISHPQRGLIKFDTYPYQDDLLEDFNDFRFTVILKARQLGISTITAAYIVWLINFHRDKNVMVLATKFATAANLVKKVKSIFKNLPDTNSREYMIIGKERHDVGRENDQGYPVRGIIEGNYFYSQNFKPDRWPAGNPETGYLNTDGSPTKTEILNLYRRGKDSTYWNYAFGKRPPEELYDIEKDPQCLRNLAFDESYSSLKKSLKDKLIGDLKQQGDPRVLGNGDVFDQYPYSGENVKNFYSRHMGGEKIKTHWVNPSDFEK